MNDDPMRRLCATLAALLLAATAHAAPDGPIPAFEATALTGETVSSAGLIGQPTVLIVTPSKAAAGDTRKWAGALHEHLDPRSVRVRDVLAIDLPFFMSEADAIGRAKQKIPARYYDQTWILDEPVLEKALGIPPDSQSAFVLVLNADGRIVARVSGAPTKDSIGQIESAVRSLK